MSEILLVVGLVLVLEGGLYAAFPKAMKRMMIVVMAQSADALRMVGLGVATAGVVIVWLVKNFLQ